MIPGMLGRALFALVCLIITAGALLPMYPRHVEAPGPLSADPALLIAGSAATDCRDCALGDADGARCRSVCSCDRVLSTASASPEPRFSLTVHLVVLPLPAGLSFEPRPLPPKLPAI
jgi:hypothetical protein